MLASTLIVNLRRATGGEHPCRRRKWVHPATTASDTVIWCRNRVATRNGAMSTQKTVSVLGQRPVYDYVSCGPHCDPADASPSSIDPEQCKLDCGWILVQRPYFRSNEGSNGNIDFARAFIRDAFSARQKYARSGTLSHPSLLANLKIAPARLNSPSAHRAYRKCGCFSPIVSNVAWS